MPLSVTAGTVYLIDDDDLILHVHATLLASMGVETRCFGSAQSFLERYQPGPRECILSDLRMPDMHGLALQQQLLARELDTPLIVITGHADVSTAVEAMRYGAFDYVPKPVDGQQLLQRVAAALKASEQRYQQRQAKAERAARIALLTPQEHKIAKQVVRGQSSREIAVNSGLSVRTVENHRARVMDKLNAQSVVDMVRQLL